MSEIFDTILTERVKVGKAQIVPLLFLSLVELNDGAQLVLSILISIIRFISEHRH